jgi:inorganic pyrophosphatase
MKRDFHSFNNFYRGLKSGRTKESDLGAKGKKSLSDLTQLRPFDKETRLLQVVVETPSGSRNKFSFDPEMEAFHIKSVLPAGMEFPYEFGFVPQTKADDGDPIDVLLLMDEPAYPGVVVKTRLIGVIEGEQKEGKKTVRNDRLVGVSAVSHDYANINKFKDLPEKWIDELTKFFVNYAGQQGKDFRVLGVKNAEEAIALVDRARKNAKRQG